MAYRSIEDVINYAAAKIYQDGKRSRAALTEEEQKAVLDALTHPAPITLESVEGIMSGSSAIVIPVPWDQ